MGCIEKYQLINFSLLGIHKKGIYAQIQIENYLLALK